MSPLVAGAPEPSESKAGSVSALMHTGNLEMPYTSLPEWAVLLLLLSGVFLYRMSPP